MRDFELEVEYPSSPEDVCRMLTDPEFLEFRWTQMPQVNCQVQVEQAGEGTFVSRAQVELAKLAAASAYVRLLPEELEIEVVENWTNNPRSGLIAQGDFEVRFGKVPVQVKAESILEPCPGEENRARRKISGTLQVNMPLIGGKVERELLAHLQVFADGEEEAATRWLAK